MRGFNLNQLKGADIEAWIPLHTRQPASKFKVVLDLRICPGVSGRCDLAQAVSLENFSRGALLCQVGLYDLDIMVSGNAELNDHRLKPEGLKAQGSGLKVRQQTPYAPKDSCQLYVLFQFKDQPQDRAES